MTKTPLAAVILAGGRSSRMGHDKALIAIGAETLLQRTCRIALACADAVYIVTPWPDRYRAQVPEGVEFVPEPPTPGQAGAFQGPTIALIAALETLSARSAATPDWVLTLACDMPNLSATVLATWREQLAALAPHHLAYLPQRQQRWEPLCGFYRTAALDSLKRYANTGGRWSETGPRGPSLQGWLKQQAVPGRILVSSQSSDASRIVPIPQVDGALLTNVNTPEELAEWQQARAF
ncbi:molybdenum cofactor guanylyltransferase [Nodosilinea sp. PGN35]|uniref:molybdenum cofactor guanylyltransferase n=1 Tax=Nodosilinea sp. PGN35 TaxID=3020489 RepID=UPI0023B2BEC8|nr:molybdenum cofactor guanylyltransferase [Nodosilinea sp. TSF1-S3]